MNAPRLVTAARPARVDLDHVDALHVGAWLTGMSRAGRPNREVAEAFGVLADQLRDAEWAGRGPIIAEVGLFQALSIGHSLRAIAQRRIVRDIRGLTDLRGRPYVEIFDMFDRVGALLVAAAMAGAAEAGR